MKSTLLLAFLLPLFASSQNRDHVDIDFGLIPSGDMANTFSAKISGNAATGKLFTIGGGFGVTKFKDNNNLCFPLFARVTVTPNTKGSIFPFLIVEPGYGIFKQVTDIVTTKITTRGGPSLYSGIGVGFFKSSLFQPYISAGYSLLSFDTENKLTANNSIEIKVGVRFIQ